MLNQFSLNKDSYSVKEILEIASEIFDFNILKKKDGIPEVNKTLDTYIRRYFSDNDIVPYSNEPRNRRYAKKDVENFFQDNKVFRHFLKISKNESKSWNNIADEYSKNLLKHLNPQLEDTEIEFADPSNLSDENVFSEHIDDPALNEFVEKMAAKTKDNYEVPRELIKKTKLDIALEYIFNECIKINENELEKDLWNMLYGDCLRNPELAKVYYKLNNLSLYYKKRK